MATAEHHTTKRKRTHDPEGRRRSVLESARRLFTERGFDQTSIRAIAADADVNPALVITYFGSKEALFREIVSDLRLRDDVLPGELEGLGARLARRYVERWEHMSADDPWQALLRSAMTHAPSEQIMRSVLDVQLATPLRAIFGDEGTGPSRNALVRCLLIGTIMERYVFRFEPACSLPAAQFEEVLGNTLQFVITGAIR
ncbi:TetR family transcriptional regulator [Nocardia sp. NPDC006630]|uniref:TetR/AcrR family transcriptional regulator n=1 Tax=Nocardia sp. NPDC006630 TaxID=3157181 RepID=UPI00339F63A7